MITISFVFFFSCVLLFNSTTRMEKRQELNSDERNGETNIKMDKTEEPQVKGEDEVFIIVEENKNNVPQEKVDQNEETRIDHPDASQLEENQGHVKVPEDDDKAEEEHDVLLESQEKKNSRGPCSFFGTLENPVRRRVLCVLLCCVLFVILYTVALTLGMLFGLPRRSLEITEGAVVSDHETCSKIGRDTLAEGGSAVDASISTLLCVGLMSSHSTGIGGGNFMVVYNAKNRKVTTIDARETAPVLVNQRMFQARQSLQSALFIGVPGELKGYWEAHKLHGRLPWKRLFQPSIDLAENGHHLSYPTAEALKLLQNFKRMNLTSIPGMCEIFCENGRLLTEGAVIKRPKLAKTLRGIAEKGIDYFYKGSLADEMAKEIQAAGGIMKKKDFETYDVRVDNGISVDLGEVNLLTLGAPSGGPVLGLILNILKGLNLTPESMSTLARQADTYHAIVEAFKLSYAERTKLADPYFVASVNETVKRMITESFATKLRRRLDRKQTHNISYYTDAVSRVEEFGTAHVSVLAPNGDAVSITSSINYYFGSVVVSPSTGIIWNNIMADFSLPRDSNPKVSDFNTVAYGKRPLSSMVPAIFVDKEGGVRLIVGAAGGSKITTTVAQVSADILWLGDDVSTAVRRKRVHHQLYPNDLLFEPGFPQDVIDELEKKGHNVKKPNRFVTVVEAIARNSETGEITGFADERKISGQAKYLRKKYDVAFY